MKVIKTVRIISNGYGFANEFVGIIKDKILKEGINVKLVEKGDADLILVLGGDGTVISAVRETNFSADAIYFSVNFGNKGYLTNINKENALEIVIDILKNPKNYSTKKINILDIDIVHVDGAIDKHYALNEIWLKGENDKPIDFKQYSSEGFLHRVSASGLIIATPSGSTAVSMSAGGPVIINGDVMVSKFNLVSEVLTDDRYFTNPIVDTNMAVTFITRKEFETDQVKKGNVKNGKFLYEHSKYKLCVEVDSIPVVTAYPEEIEKVEVKLSKHLQFVNLNDETRTAKMRECILKIKGN